MLSLVIEHYSQNLCVHTRRWLSLSRAVFGGVEHEAWFAYWLGAEPDPLELQIDETEAANPEEIELDDGDDDGDGKCEEAAEAFSEAAEAAKQDLGDDNSMFQSDSLHNFDASAALQAQGGQMGTQDTTVVSAALAAIVPTASQSAVYEQNKDEGHVQ